MQRSTQNGVIREGGTAGETVPRLRCGPVIHSPGPAAPASLVPAPLLVVWERMKLGAIVSGNQNHMFGLKFIAGRQPSATPTAHEGTMHSIIYLVGLVVVVLAILSFIGLA